VTVVVVVGETFGRARSRTPEGVRLSGGVRCSLVTGTATEPRETT
jgi:asparagine synthetase B (glutamine-hydrolysing)